MRVQRLLVLALLFAAGWAGPANADPISTAIVTWVATAAFAASTAGVITIAALDLALAYGLSYVASALAGKPPSSLSNGGTIQASGVIPRSFMVGSGMTAGKLAYINTWGNSGATPNAYLVQVIALADLPCTGLTGLVVNGVSATYGSGSPDASLGYAIPEYYKNGAHHLWVKFHDGTQTAADSYLLSKFSADPYYPYTSSRIGKGVAYVIVTSLVEPQLFSGFPNFRFVLDGAKFYDPRLDSTAGGSGSHRFADQTTWAWTDNPMVIEYNILRGITYNGAWFYGLQSLNAARLPTSSWFAAMNACDALVSKNTGGTEKQYRVGGEISVDAKPVDAIDELNKSCNGRLAEIGGVYKPHIGAAISPVFSFTDADLLSTTQQTFDQFPSLSQLINAVTASFPDPAQAFAMTPAPGRFSSAYQIADGDRQLVTNIDYKMVPYAEQVQRLMASALAEGRRFRTHTIPLGPSAWAVEPLDYVSWTSDRNGYSSKTFRVDLGTDTASLDQVLVLTETDAADYNWTPASDYIPYSSGTLALALPASQPMAGFSVSAATLSGDGGRQGAAILLSWTTSGITDVDGVLYQVRLASDSSSVINGQTDHFSNGSLVISENILSGTAYQVRAQFRPSFQNRAVDWSSWINVTTSDIRIAAIDIYDAAIGLSKLDATLTTDIAQIAINTAGLASDVAVIQKHDARLRDVKADLLGTAAALLAVQALIPDLQASTSATIAFYRQEITQQFTAGINAEAQARTDLAAIVTGLISNNDSAYLASRITTLETTSASLVTGKASATALTTLDSQINTPSTGLAAQVSTNTAAIAALDPSSASASLTQVIIAARGQNLKLDSLGNTVMGILSNLNDLATGQTATLAYYRNEITTQVINGVSANADAIGQLGVILATNVATLSASITTETSARVTATGANASQITTILAALTGLNGSGAVQAYVDSESTARVSGDATNAGNITTQAGRVDSVLAAISGLTGTGTVKAYVDSESTARVGGDSANAASIASITAQLTGLAGGTGTVKAYVDTESTARVGGDNANAASIVTANSAIGNVNATGYFSVATQATPGDAQARIALLVSATAGGTPKTAGMFIDALSDGTSRIIFSADKLLITDGSTNSSPFQFSGGTLFVKTAVIPNLSADIITTGNLHADLITVGTLDVARLATGSLGTSKLAANSVTSFGQLSAWANPGSWVITGTVANLFGTGQYAQATYDASAKVLVNFSGSFTRQGGHSPTVTLVLRRYTGTGTDPILAYAYSGGSGVAANQPFQISYCDLSPYNNAGYANYYVQASSDDASVTVNNGVLWVMSAAR